LSLISVYLQQPLKTLQILVKPSLAEELILIESAENSREVIILE
jgi:hypothetical protein